MSNRALIISVFAAAMAVAGVVSYWASERPDGLDRSIEDHGLRPSGAAPGAPEVSQGTVEGEALSSEKVAAASPLADYRVARVRNEFVSNALAGIIGSLAVLAVTLGIGYLLVRRRRRQDSAKQAA